MKATVENDNPRRGLAGFIFLRVPRARLIVWLELATVAYVGLPVLIWILAWLRLPVAVVLAVALPVAAALGWRETRAHFRQARDDREPASIAVWPLMAAALLGVVWGIYSGAGGFAFPNMDWVKHFAVLRDLVELEWPIVYKLDDKTVPFVYYIAYYLPAALMGVQFGWWWACMGLLIWTIVGILIALTWFVLLVGSRPFLAVVYFILANGLDVIGHRLTEGNRIPAGTEHLDWWAGWNLVCFPGHYSQLVWAPQHSLAAWAVTGLLAVQISAGRSLSHAGFLAVLAAFWSPFTLIGMIPLALFAAVREKGRGLISIANIVAVPLFAVFAAYLLSRTDATPKGWVLPNLRDDWLRFALAMFLEWGIFAIFAAELRRSENPRLRGLFWAAVAALALLPLYRLGVFNDWCMRATIPAMFLLWAGVGRSLLRLPFTVESRVLLVLCIFGAMGALTESARSWKTRSTPLPMDAHDHVPYIEADVARQYFGTDTTFFFKHLAHPYKPITPDVRVR